MRYPEWIQGALNVFIGSFRWYGLVENVEKYKAVKCQPGTFQSRMSEEEMRRHCTGRGETHHKQLRILIPCLDYGV